mmetsp:Transcript_12497/g.34693  ORF Transcript_12497/g.34693 Transcript_12497/m.34693 type:complete len:338 (-) Transcript_12497:145-1158(-)
MIATMMQPRYRASRLILLWWSLRSTQGFIVGSPCYRSGRGVCFPIALDDRSVSATPSTVKFTHQAAPTTTSLKAIGKDNNYISLRFVRRTIRRVVGQTLDWFSSFTILTQRTISSDFVQDYETHEQQERVQTANDKDDSNQDEGCSQTPVGPRWAVSSTDLSGHWKPIITPAFLRDYDVYLQHCGEGILFRKALLTAIKFSKEIYDQRDHGTELSITGTTTIGQGRGWERVLVASGATATNANKNSDESFEPIYTTFADPDGDMVSVEAWWENDGRNHKSWLRNKPRVQGGEFETTRYLHPDDPDLLICEAAFHPAPDCGNKKLKESAVKWTFARCQ